MNLLPRLTTALLFSCVLLLSADGFSQQYNWAKNIGSNSPDVSNTVYVNDGNVYIAGRFTGSADFDPGPATFTMTSAGQGDGFVARYTSTGQFLWAFRYGGTDRDEANALAFDQSNNVYVTGFFRSSNVDFDPGAGVAILNSNGDNGSDPGYGGDMVLAKYNASGQYQWAFNIGGSEYDNGISLTTDPSGNVYVGGYFRSGNVDFDPGAGTHILNSGTGALFFAKYNTNGVYQWAFNTGLANADNSVFELRTDNAGNLYATGFFQGTNIDFDPGPGVGALSSAGDFEMFLAKYNTSGQYQWAFKVGGGGLDIGRGITLDNAGNIYVVGDFQGADIDFDPSAGTALLSSNGSSDVFLAKYNSAGQYQWAFNFGGTPGDIGWKITNDGSHLFVTGGFTGTTDLNPSPTATDNLTSAGGYDIFLGKYTFNGEYMCSARIGRTGDDFGYSIAAGGTNLFYLTGSFQGSNVDFDPTTATANLSSAGSDDIFLASYTWPDNTVPPAGTLAGSTICNGSPAQLTFTATVGTGPFTIVYSNGTTTITQSNVQSGVPFTVLPAPTATTTYTLVSVRDAQRCSESSFPPGISAVVTVNNCTTVPDCKGFQLALGGNGYDRAIDVAVATDGSFYAAGESESYTASRDILVSKLTSSGTVTWSRAFGGSGVETVRKITATADGGLLVTGQTKSFTNPAGDILCMKIAGDGTLVWSRKFGLGSANGDLGMDIIETSDGGYAITGILTSAQADAIVIKLDNALNIQWTKRFNSGSGDDGVGILQSDNTLVVTMDQRILPADYQFIIMKLNIADGAVILTKRFTAAARGLFNPYLFRNPAGAGYCISGHTIDQASYSNMNHAVITVDENFNFVKSQLVALNTSTKEGFTGFVPLADGGFIGTTTSLQANADADLYRINSDNSVRFSKSYNHATDGRRLYRIAVAGQTLVAVGGLTRNGQEDFFITALDIAGTMDASCDVQDGAPGVQQPGYTVNSYTWPTVSSPTFSNTAASLTAAAITVGQAEICSCTDPIPCSNWMQTPSLGSKFAAGDIDVAGNQMTVEAVFNRTQPLNNGAFYGHLVSKHTDQTNVNYALLPNGCEITTTNGYKSTFQTCPVGLNKTYHVAMVYDGVTLKYYQNGFLVSQVPCTGNLITNDLITTIGQVATSATPVNNQFLGYVNEVRIWNVARTQAEIRTFMNASLPNPATQTGLKAYYTFDNATNDQGNAAYNGVPGGGAVINQTNPNCIFAADSCRTNPPEVSASFTATATACVNQPVNISNTSQNATSYYWSFCAANSTVTPTAVNLGNPGNTLSAPVFSDIVNDNGSYYVFVTNNWPGKLTRLDFGNSLLNTPTVTDLGNLGGVLVNTLEGIQVVRNEGKWYAIIVGGSQVGAGIPSRVIRVEFGASITNPAPVATNWGNIGNLAYPIDLHLFQEGGIWYGLTVNSDNNTITRFNFTGSFSNTPTGVNLGNPSGMLIYPMGIYAISESGAWHVFVTDGQTGSRLVRLDFGSSLLNTPTAVNLGNPGNLLQSPRDIYILKECGRISAFAVNQSGTDKLVKLDFGSSILSTPTITSLGNIGNMSFPHSISKFFRVGSDLYTFVTNVDNHTVTRIRFAGCTGSSIPNSSAHTPPAITYATPGTYNITLTIDDGLPTQATVCQQVVVTACAPAVTAGFTIPATVCVNQPVPINNTSQNATSYYWSFCAADPATIPTGLNLGNPGSSLVGPVYSDMVKANGNYYLFVVNHWPGGLVRLDFGNSYLNTPTAVNLGNVGGIIPNSAEGIQMVYNNGHWLALIMAGSPPNSIPSRIIKIDFGATITNTSPVGTNWGNIGGLNLPHELHVFQEGGAWYGLTVNAQDNTVTRLNFTSDLVNNTPTGVNLGTFSGLNYPTGINAVNDNGNWHVFITSDNDNPSLVRLDFGTSLLNTPISTNLGNPGGVLKKTRDIYVLKDCGQINAFLINGFGVNQLVKLNFGGSITAVPTATNLGNVGGLNFPHSISTLFRVGNDLYTFVPNNTNSTITRIRFAGCSSSSIPNSSVQAPAPVTYNTPGTYNITLTIDDGLPTQATVCRQVVVTDCQPVVINEYTEVLAFDPCKNKLTVSDATKFNAGDTVLMIQMKGAVIDVTNTPAFGTVTDYANAGNYEYNYIKSKTGNEIELLNVMKRQYTINGGKVQLVRVPYFQDYNVTRKLTAAPWDGNKGGVLAFNVQNTLTLNTDIDVSGKGFRGGASVNNLTSNLSCSEGNYIYPLSSQRAAPKGESIADVPATIIKGKGAPASGGGGGQDHNSGGGGGGNGGTGGLGGYQFAACSAPGAFDNRGIPGRSLGYSNPINKIFLGGGGGAGHANDAPAPGAGGNGGGIAIISCNTLNANGYSIISNGETPAHVPTPAPNEDGRNGGGAGGTILLNYATASGVITTSVKGGNGDYCAPPPAQLEHGPGGGGGGGIIWVNKPVLGNAFAVSMEGGINGVNTTMSNNPWGAAPGSKGDTLGNLVIPVADVLFKPNIDSVRIRKAAVSCSHYDFEGLGYVNASPVVSWQWYIDGTPGATTQNTSHAFTASGTHDVKLVITDANGCKDSITTQVETTVLNFDFSYSRDACDPIKVQFTGIGSGTGSTYWSFGDGNSATGVSTVSHTYAATGYYTVKYSITNGVCTDTVTKTINIDVVQDPSLVLTRDTTICYGATKQLLSAPSLDFCWTPVTYLDNPNSPNPVTSSTENITYYLIAQVTGTNLITNGDFTQGNTGFTSAYTHAMPNTTEGQYFIGTNPRTWNGGMSACGDHTTGTGNMMMVNGAPVAGVNVWKQTVTVTPNTNYAFSTWIQSVVSVNPAQVQFAINGKDVSTPIVATVPQCTWVQFYTTWNSGNSTSAEISIVNKNTILAGNDFALDDISFAPVFIRRDSVKITVEKPLVKTNNDTTICAKSPVQLVATGAQTYVWSPEIALTDPAIANPVASPADTTRYIVTGTSVNGCTAKDTVYVNVFAKPDITTAADAVICKNTSIPLSASGGVSYNWFPAATLTNPGSATPVATPAGNTTYYVTVTDVHDCDHLDSVKIAIRPDAVFAVSGAGPVCIKDSVQLTASGGDAYSWHPATGLSSSTIANPKASPSANTDYVVTITESACNQSDDLPVRVTVLPLPAVQATRSNDIDCSYGESQLRATGAATYAWTPSAGLSSSLIANPVATPAVTTSYVVTGTTPAGCKNRDTVVVKVEAANKGDYLMPNAFTPNNDGLNDCYGVKQWGIIEELEFSIYNRWGELIFFTKNPGQCWDGTYKGVKQNSGVFVYMIKAKTNCESKVFRKGTLVLIR